MNSSELLQALPNTLEGLVQKNLLTGERILVRLKGAFKEALICTEGLSPCVRGPYL
jgi:hypothetical protein